VSPGRRLTARVVTALVLASAPAGLAGCDDAAYCFARCGEGAGGSGGLGGGGATGGGGEGNVLNLGGGGEGGGVDCGDTQSSLANCGQCGKKCEPAAAFASCVMGECVIDECLPGYYDLDGLVATGCEYQCLVPEPGPEQCNGIDDDCDGLVDQADPDLTPPPALCNKTPGTPCEATVEVCDPLDGWTCNYPLGVETVAGIIRVNETLCDGVDGNCDGDVDEWFTALGQPCKGGGLGVCEDGGLLVCDPQNPYALACDLSFPPDAGVPGPEACNGLDDDCNGFVDDALPESAFAMIDVPGSSPPVRVDVYEASRPDASAQTAGLSESVACSAASRLPWTGGSYSEAEAACAARGPGYRLCTASELEATCRSALDLDYPYGLFYDEAACNGVEAPAGALLPTGSLALCESVDGAFDLSGNAAEWTSTQTNAAAAPDRIFQLHGGSYLAPELGLACTIELAPRALEGTLLPNIGFRCCFDAP
jgi:hypothetical protein